MEKYLCIKSFYEVLYVLSRKGLHKTTNTQQVLILAIHFDYIGQKQYWAMASRYNESEADAIDCAYQHLFRYPTLF
jgi:hypothetical protein